MTNALAVLKKYWGHNSFRGSQETIIQNILAKQDVLALLPTGAGKSVCFQVPALVEEGICIVVSPLVALIQDQVQSLKNRGIKAIGLIGGIPLKELDTLLDNCIYGNYKFLYLSPERLRQPLVQERIRQMPVNLIAIDEAHCISEWGHDFRPTYRRCVVLKQLHDKVPLIALTATATRKVVDDILVNLTIANAQISQDSFKRANIHFIVERKEDKINAVKRILEKTENSAIVYVRSRKESELLSKQLNHNAKVAGFFHGGLTSLEKKERLTSWLRDELRIMIATNAFGMGVDKADVNTVIHFQIPESIENYYQEAGRAGRNGKAAKAVLLVNENDILRAKSQFLESLPNLSFVKLVYQKLMAYFQIAYNEGKDEIFHFNLNSFCSAYHLYPSKVYTTLKLLDQNGVLSLSQMSKELNSIRLVSRKEELFAWIEKYKDMGTVLQTLLRTYGGVFEFDTKINLALIAKKSSQSQHFVHQTLLQLERDGLASYHSEKQDVQITFLTPREDNKTIRPIAGNIDTLIQTKKDKFRAMIAYASNTKKCRTNMLLDYFGEKVSKPCGTCDICLSQSNKKIDLRKLKSDIQEVLTKGNKSSRELTKEINGGEKDILIAIQELLEDGKIKLKANNTYGAN